MERRTTIRLDAVLLDRAKRAGLDTGRTLTAVITDALRAHLARPQTALKATKALPVSRHTGGTWPGVNLDSWAELLERMEQPGDR